MSHLRRMVTLNREVDPVPDDEDCYLENMKIADVRRLACRLGVSLLLLLDASISLSEDVRNRYVEGAGDLPELGHTDVPVSV